MLLWPVKLIKVTEYSINVKRSQRLSSSYKSLRDLLRSHCTVHLLQQQQKRKKKKGTTKNICEIYSGALREKVAINVKQLMSKIWKPVTCLTFVSFKSVQAQIMKQHFVSDFVNKRNNTKSTLDCRSYHTHTHTHKKKPLAVFIFWCTCKLEQRWKMP